MRKINLDKACRNCVMFNSDGTCFLEEDPNKCDLKINKEIVKDIVRKCEKE